MEFVYAQGNNNLLFCYQDYTILNSIVENDNLAFCQKLLQDNSDLIINYPSRLTNTHPIHLVKNKAMAELLVKFKANLNAQNIHGDTILHILCQKIDLSTQSLELINYILENGINITIKNNYHKTALELATNHQVKEIIKRSIKSGPQIQEYRV